MIQKRFLVLFLPISVLAVPGFLAANESTPELTPMEKLGKFLFFDDKQSNPPGQSCAACHAPEWGFTGPDSEINATQAVYPGAVHARAGNR